jgi:hypothetical protein
MSENTPLPNDPASRSPTGEITNQLPNQPTTNQSDQTTSETKTQPSTTDNTSLLNKPGDKEPPKEPGKEPPKAPTEYGDWKVPDGFTLDDTVKGEVNTMFKELNLTQDQGQKLVDYYVKQVQAVANEPYETYRQMRNEWATETQGDPEVGGRNLEQTKQTISKALDQYPDQNVVKAFKEKMDLTGAGDLLPFVKIFHWLAKQVTEGAHVRGNNPVGPNSKGATRPSLAGAMFPNLPQAGA